MGPIGTTGRSCSCARVGVQPFEGSEAIVEFLDLSVFSEKLSRKLLHGMTRMTMLVITIVFGDVGQRR